MPRAFDQDIRALCRISFLDECRQECERDGDLRPILQIKHKALLAAIDMHSHGTRLDQVKRIPALQRGLDGLLKSCHVFRSPRARHHMDM